MPLYDGITDSLEFTIIVPWAGYVPGEVIGLMCLYCHRDDPEFDTNPAATYETVHLRAHGDGNSDCLRVQSDGQLYCVDCKQVVPGTLENEDHICAKDE